MTADTPPSENQDSSEIVRPNFTIKQHHNQLLDELAETRYASRSEALRAAIVALSQSVLEDGETATTELLTQMDVLESKINNLTDKLNEIHPDPNARDERNSKNYEPDSREDVLTPVSSTDSINSSEIENDVYSVLHEQGPISHEDLVSATELTQLELRQGLNQLSERGFITSSTEGRKTHYQVRDIDE